MNIDLGQTIHDLKSLPVALSAEQQAELARRLEAYKTNPEDVLTWDQVLEQLRGRL